MVSYEVVHVKPDKSEEIVGIVETPTEISLLTEVPKYSGAWISETRKILRHGKGEIVLRERAKAVRVADCQHLRIGNMLWYELPISYHDELKSIILNDRVFIGYGDGDKELWKAYSFLDLAKIVGKEVAYQCSRYYQKYLEEFNVEGAM